MPVLWLSAVLGAGAAPAAEPQLAESAALRACAPDRSGAVTVTFDAADGLFRSAAGDAFLATDLRHPGPDTGAPASLQIRSDGQSRRFSAVPLGPPDRWGRVPAWIVVTRAGQAELWQARQLEDGHAVFAPRRGTADCGTALRRAETRARQAEAGFWHRNGPARIYPADRPGAFSDAEGRYVIVRGRIVSLGKTRSTRYLNFGKYWTTDLTGTVRTRDDQAFNAALGAAGWTLDDLAGRFVELRGIVERRDGPHIALRHPGQLLVLEDKRAGRDGQGNN